MMRADLRRMTPEERLRHLQRTRAPWSVCTGAPGHRHARLPGGRRKYGDGYGVFGWGCVRVISDQTYSNAVYMHCHWHNAYPRDPHRCKWVSPESIRPVRPTLDELKRLLRDGPERPKRRAIERCAGV